MVSLDLVEDYDGGGNWAGPIWDGLDLVPAVVVVVADAIEEFPPLSLLTVDFCLLKYFIEATEGAN